MQSKRLNINEFAIKIFDYCRDFKVRVGPNNKETVVAVKALKKSNTLGVITLSKPLVFSNDIRAIGITDSKQRSVKTGPAKISGVTKSKIISAEECKKLDPKISADNGCAVVSKKAKCKVCVCDTTIISQIFNLLLCRYCWVIQL